MLSVQDRENIMGWAYVWLKDAAWTNTRATYCDVEPVCCDDIAKVWFLMSLIKRSTGVLGEIVCKDVTETITVEGNPATLTLNFVNLPQNFQLFNGFLYGSDSGFFWRTSITSPVYSATSQLPIRNTLAENAQEFVNWFNWYVANYPTTDPSGATLSASVNGTQIVITTNVGTTFFNGSSQNGFILVDQDLWFGNTQQLYFLTGGTNNETETITVEVCEFVDSPDIELLYQRLQCLIGLSTVTTCPENCFPCQDPNPPTPTPTGCTLQVGSGCCDYSVEGIELNQQFNWCYNINVDELIFTLSFPEVTPVFILFIANDTESFYYQPTATYPSGTTNIDPVDLFSKFALTPFIDPSGKLTLTYNEKGFCLSSNFSFTDNIRVQVGSNQSEGIVTPDLFCQTDIATWGGNVNLISESCFSNNRLTTEFNQNIYIFQVLINDVWTDVTDEVTNGTWSRTNVCDDVITQWRVIDSEENVINSGEVTATCDESAQVTDSVCNWLQAHQTAIEQLQEGSGGLTCETIGDCEVIQTLQQDVVTAQETADNALQVANAAYPDSNPDNFIDQAGARSALSFVSGSGGYNSGTGVISIPTNNNELTNGAGYITSAALNPLAFFSGSAGHTGDTNETIVQTIAIPSTAWATNAVYQILARTVRIAGSVTFRVRMNTTPDLTGSPISILEFTTTSGSANPNRLLIKTGNSFEYSTLTTISDLTGVSTTATATVSTASTTYIMLTIQGSTGAANGNFIMLNIARQ